MANIIQWNINGYNNHKEYLQFIISDNNAEIICIQESNLKDQNEIKLRNFTCYNKNRHDCTHASGGVAMLINNNLYSKEIPITTNLEAVACKVLIKNQLITICNIYLSNRFELKPDELTGLIAQLPEPKIILGDFNSHNYIWGSEKTDKRGKIIEKILNSRDLILLNDLSPTYFSTANNKNSCIDLTLCSSRLATKIEWRALDELYGSDHYPIKIGIDQLSSYTEPHVQRFMFDRANWDSFKKSITAEIPLLNEIIDNQHNTDINEIIEKLNEIILNAANENIPKSTGKMQRKTNPWWNTDCKNAIAETKHALIKYKRHNTEENKIEFKRLKAIAKRTVKESKTQSWQTFLQTLNDKIPTKMVWNKIKAIEGRKTLIIPAIEENGQIINDTATIADILAGNIAKNSSDDNYSKEFHEIKAKADKTDEPTDVAIGNDIECQINQCISKAELLNALNSTKNTSPGPDLIHNILIKNLPNAGLECLLNIYNKIWTCRIFPDLWNQAIVIPILKPGKNKFKKDSYRPISLTCCLCKLFEKIINKRLRWYLESNNIIKITQSGFRENCSTLDCLARLESDICDALNNKQHLVAVCLDMEKAYDLIWRRRVLELLLKHNITGNTFNFIKNFLNKRVIRVRVNNALSNPVVIQNGVPQGSVLSVTLFMLAFNDVTDNIPRPVGNTIFADDATIFIKGKNLKTSQTIIQTAINNLNEYAHNTGFKISQKKTVAIIFSKRNLHETIQLHINNTPIEIVNEIKILGLTFDSKLNWKTHIANLKRQCYSKMNVLKCIAGKNWGANQNILSNTFKALIQTKLDYGSAIYNSASEHSLKSLDPILNTSLRIVTGAYRTSPTLSILSEAKAMPLSYRRKENTMKYAVRLLAAPKNQAHNLIQKTTNKNIKNHPPIYHRAREHFNELKIKDPKIYASVPLSMREYQDQQTGVKFAYTNEEKITENSLNHEFNKISILTAKNMENIGGIAQLPGDEQIMLKFPKWTSEESAIETIILHTINNVKTTENKFIIYTNNNKVIKNIQHSSKGSSREIRNKLNHLEGKIIINFSTFPEPNQLLNLQTSAEQSLKLNYPSLNYKNNKEDLYKYISTMTREKWNTHWINSPKGTDLKQIRKNTYERNPTKKLTRKDQIVITRLRIGHTKITHEHLISKKEKHKCENCDMEMSREHIILQCPYLSDLRKEHKLANDICAILSKPEQMTRLISFLNRCNLMCRI